MRALVGVPLPNMPARIVSPLIGEPLPLDLVNTARSAAGEAGDVLASVGGLEEWLLAEADRLPVVTVTARTLDRVRALRGHVQTLVDAARFGDRLPPDAMQAVNELLRAAPSFPQLSWDDGVRVDTARIGSPEAQLLAALAEATVEFLASPLAVLVRECAAADCTLLFAATHARRRWCSASICGNRTRVGRYYARHRLTDAVGFSRQD
jgi:predicted RNA-binding Zn ribbon-like protein